MAVANRGALRNPDSLDFYEKIKKYGYQDFLKKYCFNFSGIKNPMQNIMAPIITIVLVIGKVIAFNSIAVSKVDPITKNTNPNKINNPLNRISRCSDLK